MASNLIYFNNAATSWPKPQKVIEEVNTSLVKPYQEHGRTTDQSLLDYPKLTRKKLARFFNSSKPQNFIFTSNATDSLNLLIHGFREHKNEKIHVITSELEHNSVLRPLNTLQKNDKIALSVVSSDDNGYVTLDAIKQVIQSHTELMVLNHGSNVLGTVQDIDTIGKYLQKENIFFIVDTAQTAGHVKIDLKKTPVDALVFTGHKAMYGFQGIGGFYISGPELIESYKQGGTGVFSEYPFHPQEMPLKFEYGTHNYPGIVSLYAGLQFIEEIGLDALKKKTDEMTHYIIEEFEKIENVVLYNSSPDLPLIPFDINGMDQDDVGFLLQNQFNIMTRTGLHCAPLVHKKIDDGRGCVRASLSYFNTLEECDYFVDAVRKIAESVLLRSTV